MGEGVWPGVGEDLWDSKAARWMAEEGVALVRAGLAAWRDAGRRVPEGSANGRRVGVIGLVQAPGWPGWLEGQGPAEIAKSWRKQPPLWLLGCLPNVPVAQLAIEVGARGPVETIRAGEEGRSRGMERVRFWLKGRVDRVLWVESFPGKAWASVWQREGV